MKIVHIMADGTRRDSVKGYEIPYNENTKIIYQLMAKAEAEEETRAE
ncbi:MAG: hypothetical protein AB9836_06165 [Aminipila sp.]